MFEPVKNLEDENLSEKWRFELLEKDFEIVKILEEVNFELTEKGDDLEKEEVGNKVNFELNEKTIEEVNLALTVNLLENEIFEVKTSLGVKTNSGVAGMTGLKIFISTVTLNSLYDRQWSA